MMNATDTETELYEPNPFDPPAWQALYALIHEIGSGWDHETRNRIDNAVGELHRETERATRQRHGEQILETIQGHRYQSLGCEPEYPMWSEDPVGVAGVEGRLVGVERDLASALGAINKLIEATGNGEHAEATA